MCQRVCKTCGEAKPLMDFYVQTSGSIYRNCKVCWRAYVKRNRLVRAEQYAAYERGRANLPHRVNARKEYSKTPNGREALNRGKKSFLERNPLIGIAHRMVNNAVRMGKLIRRPCEICGHEKTHAHHDDYGKPLDVRWLCVAHHTEWHRHNTPAYPDQEAA